jgi:hypothetical protein
MPLPGSDPPNRTFGFSLTLAPCRLTPGRTSPILDANRVEPSSQAGVPTSSWCYGMGQRPRTAGKGRQGEKVPAGASHSDRTQRRSAVLYASNSRNQGDQKLQGCQLPGSTGTRQDLSRIQGVKNCTGRPRVPIILLLKQQL